MPLELSGFVVKEDSKKDEDGAGGAEQGDVVTEHDYAQPHRQGMLDSTGNTERETRVVIVGINLRYQNSHGLNNGLITICYKAHSQF